MFNSRFGVGVLKHPGYNIGGGIGETLLAKIATSAAIGGGISALTGGDFLEGVLMGGLGGGIGEAFKGINLFGKAAPALGADAGTKGITAAGAQAYIPTSPFGTTEAITATSPAFSGAGSGTFGTASMANLANSGISPSVIEAARNQAIVNAGGTPGQVGGNPPAAGQVGNQTAATQSATDVAGKTPKPVQDMTPDEIIQAGNVKPYGLSNAANGPLGNASGDYVYNGKIYRGSDITKAMQPQSFFDKYKSELMLGGLGLGYKMLTAPPNTAYSPPSPSGPIMKYKLGPNYQAVPNPTPVYPRFAEGGIAQLAEGGNMEVSQPNVNFMGRDMYPMSQQDRSYYATPSQMPVSAQQTMASYEPKTNPLTGQPTVNMSSGGPISFASGGSSKVPSGQVYYDSDKGQYYTQSGGMGSMYMYGAGQPKRNYIGTSLRNPNSSGLSEDFKASSVTPVVYNPSYVDVPGTTTPMPAQTPAQTSAPAYSLNDSAQLLASVSPNIAEASNIRPMARGGIADLGTYSDGGRMLKGPGDGMSDSIPGVIANKRPARLADGEFVIPADVVSHLGNGSTDAGAKQLYAMMNKVRQARTGNKKQGKQINPRKLMPA